MSANKLVRTRFSVLLPTVIRRQFSSPGALPKSRRRIPASVALRMTSAASRKRTRIKLALLRQTRSTTGNSLSVLDKVSRARTVACTFFCTFLYPGRSMRSWWCTSDESLLCGESEHAHTHTEQRGSPWPTNDQRMWHFSWLRRLSYSSFCCAMLILPWLKRLTAKRKQTLPSLATTPTFVPSSGVFG